MIALPIVAGAVVALVLLWAYTPILRAIAYSIAAPLEPLPFGIANAVRNAVQTADGWALAFALTAAEPLVALFHALDWIPHSLMDALGGAVGELRDGGLRLMTAYLPALVSGLQDFARQRVAELLDLVARTEANMVSEYHALHDQALAYADRALALGLEAAERVRIEALGGIEAGVRTAEGYTDAQVGDLRRALSGAEQVAQRQAAQAQAGAEQFASARAAGVAAAAATTAAGIAARVASIEESNCFQECGTLGGLGAELDLLEFGLIVGLVAAMARDPRGAASIISRDVAPGFREAASELRSLVVG